MRSQLWATKPSILIVVNPCQVVVRWRVRVPFFPWNRVNHWNLRRRQSRPLSRNFHLPRTSILHIFPNPNSRLPLPLPLHSTAPPRKMMPHPPFLSRDQVTNVFSSFLFTLHCHYQSLKKPCCLCIALTEFEIFWIFKHLVACNPNKYFLLGLLTLVTS